LEVSLGVAIRRRVRAEFLGEFWDGDACKLFSCGIAPKTSIPRLSRNGITSLSSSSKAVSEIRLNTTPARFSPMSSTAASRPSMSPGWV